VLISTSVSCLKMQWTPEHTQWAEQHFDISSTTRSPAHKVESYRGHLQRTYQYAWANDDISALTASNLLKKYAEKYSGLLEAPSERALLCSYSESTTGLMNGRKAENESWQEGIYPLNCAADVISVSKAGMTAALPPTEVSASIGSSPGVASSLSEPSYSSSNCGSHTATTLHSSLASQEYTTSYNGSYLHSYSGQSTPALPSPHPSPLYNAGSPNLPNYNYPPTGYSSQTAVGPSYSPGGAPPPSAYLPSGIAAPTPIPPSTLPSYTYPSHNHTPITPTPLNGSTSGSLKRKAFYMSGHGDVDSSYGHFNYNQQRSAHSPMYRTPDSSVPDSTRGNSFDRNTDSSVAFKTSKQKFNVPAGRALTPPSYGPTKASVGDHRASEPYSKFGSPVMTSDLGSATSSIHAAEEQLKNSDPSLVDDIAGLEMVKASIKEEILWPLLRPDMFSGLATLPRSLLLFGPQGAGRTLLARCMASQLGAVFLRLNGSALVTKWLSEGDKIIHASFLMARCRQPAVVFISDIELLLSSQISEDSPVKCLKTELLVQLDSVLSSAEDHVLVVCSTSKPEEIHESLRRYFTKRLLVPLPDGTARHQIISHLLAQHNYCLSDKELSLVVQRTEGFSGLDVAQLCHEAVVAPLHGIPASDLSSMHPSQMRPVAYQDFENVFCKFQPNISQKELDMYTEWNKMFGCSQ
uniref:Fidgetin n=1 Tax=Neogobius melanostomus TaxID=47308 RepID=A0A8C6V250_9GOBI